jgi:hypothetical protein
VSQGRWPPVGIMAGGHQYPSKRRGVRMSKRVARPLLSQVLMQAAVIAVSAALGSGCLLPQEDTELGDFTRLNRPPRIVEDPNGIFPDRQTTVENGLGCSSKVDFEAPVEDPDIDDAVTWRWYIDYDPENARTNRARDEGVLPPTGEARRGSVKFGVPVADNPDFLPGVRVVTLMVFDGNLGTFEGPGSTPPVDRLPGLDAGNPRYSTTFDWIVTVRNEDCLP